MSIEKVKLSKDGSSIDFVQSDALPTSMKKFRQSPEIEGFYRFIYENDLQKEAYEILDRIINERRDLKQAQKLQQKNAAKEASQKAKDEAKELARRQKDEAKALELKKSQEAKVKANKKVTAKTTAKPAKAASKPPVKAAAKQSAKKPVAKKSAAKAKAKKR
jgi:hypothetical protein